MAPEGSSHRVPAAAGLARQEVVVVDIRIPFGSMNALMVKWAIASIPAFLILLFIGAIAVGVLGGLGGISR